MENFWNSVHPSSFSSDIAAFLESKFSDAAFYPEKTERHSSAVCVFQKPERKSVRFFDGKIRETYYFTLLSPFAGEDRKAADAVFWLLEKSLELCEKATSFSFSKSGISFLYFERVSNPSKAFRTNMGDDFYSAELSLVVERQG